MKLEVKNVTKEFKKIPVLKNINMSFESGKIYGLIGRNGSGKTVLLKMLCGFYYPSEGEILLDGENYIEKYTFLQDCGALIENPSFISDLTGYENLEMLASIQRKIGKKEILDTIEKVNLSADKDKKYSKYSLGMKQKLGVAQAIMENPKIIILDEPFNGIENETATKLRNILLEEKKKNKIIILASHIKEDITNLADVVYEFDDGNVKKI